MVRKTLDEIKIEQAAALLLAMANPKRLEILTLLVQSEMPVGTLADSIGLSQSALSQHLAKLRAEKLVSTRREAQTIYYSSQSPAVFAVLNALDQILGTDKDNGHAPHLKAANG